MSDTITPLQLPAEITDRKAFAALPEKLRMQILQRLVSMCELRDADYGDQGPLVCKAATALGISTHNVRRLYQLFRKHGWTGLVDARLLRATKKPKAAH